MPRPPKSGKTPSSPRKKVPQKKTPEKLLPQEDEIYTLPTWEGPSEEKKTPFRFSFFSGSKAEEDAVSVSESPEETVTTPVESSIPNDIFPEVLPVEGPKEKAEKLEETLRDPHKKELSKEELEPVMNLVNAIESLGLEEFIEYIKSPWRLLWPNFVAGVARGFGALVGATIVVALVIWGLSQMISLPLIGKYIEPYAKTVQGEFNKYIESTNYNEHFQQIEMTLSGIREDLQGKKPSSSQSGVLR